MRTSWNDKAIAIMAWTVAGALLASVVSAGEPPPDKAPHGGAPQQGKPPPDQGPLLVHEWGTFLSVQGSDGETLGGMVDSDEVLPGFVEARGISTWQRSLMRQKMETPVTYFYVDRPRDVQVEVRMPQGTLTHWYPAVREYGPPLGAQGKKLTEQSFLSWRRVHLIPASQFSQKDAEKAVILVLKSGAIHVGKISAEDKQTVQLINAEEKTITIQKAQIEERGITKWVMPVAALKKVGNEQTWRYVRETDSAFVKIRTWDTNGQDESQLEKFLFYRGLGKFDLPLEARSANGCKKPGVVLELRNTSPLPLRSVFAVEVARDTIRFASLGDLAGKDVRRVETEALFAAPRSLQEGVPQVKSAVAAALVSAGLYPKEAQAMVNTWERSYFRTDGIRLLYVLPSATVDGIIPIRIDPRPDQLVRVMVGRVEVLTPAREQEIEKWVTDLGAGDFKVREAASVQLTRLGRISEPALRRVVSISRDAEVKARAEVLIKKIGSPR